MLGRGKSKQQHAKKAGRVDWQDGRCAEPEVLAHYMRPAEEGRRHVITGIYAGFSEPHTGLLTFQGGPRPPLKFYCHTQRDIPCHWVLGEGEAAAVTLAFNSDRIPERAVAAVIMAGYTEDIE